MKKLITLICLTTAITAAIAQPRPDVCPACKQYVYPEFTTIKDTVTQNTIVEWYTVVGKSVTDTLKPLDRSKFKFHADPGQLDLKKDYAKSGYAIGHINSAKNNYFDAVRLKHSMLWINTDRQQQSMNAGPWFGLENHERDEAVKMDSVNIRVGVYGNIGYTKPHHYGIAAYWWKAFIYRDSTVVWVMPNVKMPQHTADYVNYKKSLKFLIDTARINPIVFK